MSLAWLFHSFFFSRSLTRRIGFGLVVPVCSDVTDGRDNRAVIACHMLAAAIPMLTTNDEGPFRPKIIPQNTNTKKYILIIIFWFEDSLSVVCTCVFASIPFPFDCLLYSVFAWLNNPSVSIWMCLLHFLQCHNLNIIYSQWYCWCGCCRSGECVCELVGLPVLLPIRRAHSIPFHSGWLLAHRLNIRLWFDREMFAFQKWFLVGGVARMQRKRIIKLPHSD